MRWMSQQPILSNMTMNLVPFAAAAVWILLVERFRGQAGDG